MPYCCAGTRLAAADNAVKLFYGTYGHGPTKVLLIIGLAGTHDYRGIQVCALDNRGVGRGSVPTKKSDYSSKIMAKDAIALLDHLGWRKTHVFGHSMGAMIACKLAAMVPDHGDLRLKSLQNQEAGRLFSSQSALFN
ncbi:hypothetical protein K1719_025330 [Acacia pycnantha]|nr:hypothetical protein K1719_025330 [Acacia pycnantha]